MRIAGIAMPLWTVALGVLWLESCGADQAVESKLQYVVEEANTEAASSSSDDAQVETSDFRVDLTASEITTAQALCQKRTTTKLTKSELRTLTSLMIKYNTELGRRTRCRNLDKFCEVIAATEPPPPPPPPFR